MSLSIAPRSKRTSTYQPDPDAITWDDWDPALDQLARVWKVRRHLRRSATPAQRAALAEAEAHAWAVLDTLNERGGETAAVTRGGAA